MPHGNAKKKNASGMGSIREKEIKKNGKSYTYWEGRVTTGYDPFTGKQLQKSVSGKTQGEVVKKMKQISVDVDNRKYVDPSKMCLAVWLDEWLTDYVVSTKESSKFCYKGNITRYITPVLGNKKLCELDTPIIQKFINELAIPGKISKKGLSPKSIKDVYSVLHSALNQAVENHMISANPSSFCKLPKGEPHEIKPLEDDQIVCFLNAINGHPHEYLYKIAMFTGLRESELLGLSWNDIKLNKGYMTVKKQLQKKREKGGGYYFSSTKSGKERIVVLADTVVELFRLQKTKQLEMAAKAGCAWCNTNNLVFTNALGDRLSYRTVYDCYKRIVNKIGLPELRFHDLRHTYATISLSCGDDIKTLQKNLGHSDPGFTLKVYGHVSEQMRLQSAERLNKFIGELPTEVI